MKNLTLNEKKVLLITVITILLISIVKKVYVFNYKYKEENNIKIRCMVIELQKLEDEKVSYLVKYDRNKFLLNVYSDDKEKVGEYANFKYGDILEFRGKINKIEKMGNPYEFDYKKYLNSNNIVTTISAYDTVNLISNSIGNPIFKISYFLKEYIDTNIDEKMSGKEAQLYKSMIYGESKNLDENIKENFSKNGMSYMLAISGVHLMYLILILDIIFFNIKDKYKKYIYSVIIIFYLIISGMSMSVVRASIMSILLISSNKLQNNKQKYINLAISYVIIVIYNPYSVFNVSGILSYLATIGILTFNSLTYSFFRVILKVPKFSYSIFKILSVTISSFILLFPIQIYYFGVIELRLFISCILTNFISSSMYFLGFLSFFLMFVPVVSDILFNATYFFTHILIIMSDFISNINVGQIKLPRPSLIELYLYYISIFFIVCKKYLSFVRKKKIRILLKKCVNVVVVFSCIIIVSLCIYRIYFEEYVIYFNVGQGNMAIIRKNQKLIVIDVGSTTKNISSNILNNFLLAKAIDKIDLVLLTHMHEDHMNGIYGINAKIDKIGYAIPKEDSDEFDSLNDFIKEQNISTIELEKSDVISFKDLKIEILMPKNNKKVVSSDVANSNSMIIYINLKNNCKTKSLLFMGDSTIETEKELLSNFNGEEFLKNIDVIQIGHHGSKTSTSEELLKVINPKIGIISSKKKVYGHPAQETLSKLEKYNIKYYITEKVGAIKFNI